MKTTITINGFVLNVEEATPTELAELLKATSTNSQPKSKDVIATTQQALQAGDKKQLRHRAPKIGVQEEDLLFIAKMAVDLGPNVESPAPIIAKGLQVRTGNRRSYEGLYSLAYNHYHYLLSGRNGNVTKRAKKILAENGYTAGMIAAGRPRIVTNFLGNPGREIAMEQA